MEKAPAASAYTSTDILDLLSQPRLEPYRRIFKFKTESELLGVYHWAQAVSANFHPLLGLLEVVLRNAIHTSLSKQCTRQAYESFAWYDRDQPTHIALKGKSLAKVEALLCQGNPPIRKLLQPSPDVVVSRLSLGFWPNVLEELNHRYAPRTFTDVFPFHPHSKPRHWSIEANKQDIMRRLKKLQDLRNRISHFEAIWKPYWLGVQASHWSQCVIGLQNLHHLMVELLGWCSQDARNHYRDSIGYANFNKLCATQAVLDFAKSAGLQA